jgi:hypothetical protein
VSHYLEVPLVSNQTHSHGEVHLLTNKPHSLSQHIITSFPIFTLLYTVKKLTIIFIQIRNRLVSI